MLKRKNYARIPEVINLPSLIEIQTSSYEDFLQIGCPKTKRENKGLQAVFNQAFPIKSYDGEVTLKFISYSLGRPKYTAEECQKRGITYAAPLKLKLRLSRKEADPKEEDVYIGDLPLMTRTGTFIINGAERIVVSQLHRSPGVSFEEAIHPSGKRVYTARLIPYRGAWLELELDINDVLFVYIDRRRKFLASTFLKALGCSDDGGIITLFYESESFKIDKNQSVHKLINRILAHDIIDKENNKLLAKAGQKISEDLLKDLRTLRIKTVKVLKEPVKDFAIINTLLKDVHRSKEEALLAIYRRMRPGDPAIKENAEALINRLFLDSHYYNLGRVGRYILNRKLKLNVLLDKRILELKDIIEAIKYLVRLKNGEGKIDDIDHLGNRRVRTIGELLQNQFRVGMARMERSILERMSIYDLNSAMPHNLINAKLISATVKDFFGRSQLSQFMDQINPLAELTHKRRLSALGPGGLSRERAGFEVRDVHYSHYGRVCPVETPEGPNIGLISSLSTYARVNEFGFLESPYRKVINERVTDKIEYLSADIEDKYAIAQANAKLDKKNNFIEDIVFCRYQDDFIRVLKGKVDYMDVSPKQLVGVSASLIPFLEHDDANRVLMGSNMQRQAVPLLTPEAPLIGTGMEGVVARDSGVVVIAEHSGVVKEVTADRIRIDEKEYRLTKFARSNASTCINQKPIVSVGDKIKKGQVIADGSATCQGELSLGRNVLVAFMPWRGYNFEDAILVSEKLLKDDAYTSIHIEEFEIEARDTKLGNEEITCDIPNVGEDALSHLDDEGIARIGVEIGPGDILAGKVTPKSETELSPEEKLLRAIFGEKAGDVRDASLTAPAGLEGIVVDVKVFSRKSAGPRTKEQRKSELNQMDKIRRSYKKRILEITREKVQRISSFLMGKVLGEPLLDSQSGAILVAKGKKISKININKIKKCDFQNIKLETNTAVEEEISKVARICDDSIEQLIDEQEKEIEYLKKGDELPPGVIKKVVVYIATKRKLSVGDKMAGRHGNKGVIAKILPEEDMPFLPDGTPVEIVLNPLGVPSRMNVGQILETHLGWAAKVLGFYVKTPVFDGAGELQIKEELRKAFLPEDGKIRLYDGRTGEPFKQKVTVGYIYVMKLAHLVADKIHARSIGPYSLVTQQPLGGKAQFGGQRFGEMEVWALEAYGAAYCLQELLTVKSDDVSGRTRIYEAIVKGENALQPGTPESFNVLIKELQSLALDVAVERTKEKDGGVLKADGTR
ncbi:MAG: DNA-directed RNA polymerase subunit beta [Candidatus Omnitrophota bacterium]|nr:DNA-directed RNA polymerase subunit beta [Candidatus Omnitrophota bacterium]